MGQGEEGTVLVTKNPNQTLWESILPECWRDPSWPERTPCWTTGRSSSPTGRTSTPSAAGPRSPSRRVEAGYRGYFTTATDMVAAMTTAYADGTFAHQMRTYTGPSVLVIDDVGITPFDRAQASAFFQVVNRRYENRSATIVTTNRGLPAWAELFGGDSVVAAAVLDRRRLSLFA